MEQRINRWHHHKGKHSGSHDPANDRMAHGSPDFRSRSHTQGNGHHPGNGGKRGHQNGPQPYTAGFHQCLIAVFPFPDLFLGKIHQQNGILGHQSHQRHDADQRNQADFTARDKQAAQSPDQGQRQGKHDDKWFCITFKLGSQDHKDKSYSQTQSLEHVGKRIVHVIAGSCLSHMASGRETEFLHLCKEPVHRFSQGRSIRIAGNPDFLLPVITPYVAGTGAIFPFCHLGQGNHQLPFSLLMLTGDIDLLQHICFAAALWSQTHPDIHPFLLVIVFPHHGAVQQCLDSGSHLRGRNSQIMGLFLFQRKDQIGRPSVETGSNILYPGNLLQFLLDLLGQRDQHLLGRTGQRNGNGFFILFQKISPDTGQTVAFFPDGLDNLLLAPLPFFFGDQFHKQFMLLIGRSIINMLDFRDFFQDICQIPGLFIHFFRGSIGGAPDFYRKLSPVSRRHISRTQEGNQSQAQQEQRHSHPQHLFPMTIQESTEQSAVPSGQPVQACLPALPEFFQAGRQCRFPYGQVQGRHHGSQGKGHKKGDQDRKSNGKAKLLEHLPIASRHEPHRQEYGSHGESGRHHSQGNFFRALERRFFGRLPHLPVAYDVFDDYDGIIGQQTHRKGQPQQGHGIQRKSGQFHEKECTYDGNGNGQRTDHRTPPVPQEPEYNEDGEYRPRQQIFFYLRKGIGNA